MTNCFGNGKCIKKRQNGYYKPFKCPYNCKLVACYHCKKSMIPLWILEHGAGFCSECLRIRHNERMMQKVFKCK
ncbi:hypothetical protein QJ857_gp1177 [Tupanvirus soda lake]|uniref:Uncharacterized protein n=2 Tax=Tupanvirus TaxID=2094720 RepID=A0A6N1NTD6_9VIRU|nr:hypothetical protein QJ857_gp1177 [Tupanvirus soda lake]QKU34878.1 hypothetical protein [Tupanvirus soda lake]